MISLILLTILQVLTALFTIIWVAGLLFALYIVLLVIRDTISSFLKELRS